MPFARLAMTANLSRERLSQLVLTVEALRAGDSSLTAKQVHAALMLDPPWAAVTFRQTRRAVGAANARRPKLSDEERRARRKQQEQKRAMRGGGNNVRASVHRVCGSTHSADRFAFSCACVILVSPQAGLPRGLCISVSPCERKGGSCCSKETEKAVHGCCTAFLSKACASSPDASHLAATS